MSKTNFNNETQFIFSNEFVGFTTIPNYIFQCKNLSFKAVGIYCSILQFQNSPNHKISIKGLMAIHSDGERSVTSGLNELLEAGFLTREQIRDNGQIKGYLYTVYMKPVENTSVPPKRHFADMENADIQNVGNKKENRKKQNTKKEKDSLTEQVQEREENTPVVNDIEKETGLTLTKSQKTKVCKWDKERIQKAIDLYVTHSGSSFAYLQKCYYSPINVSVSNERKAEPKNSTFTKTYSHNWDLAELERKEMEYIEKMYGDK